MPSVLPLRLHPDLQSSVEKNKKTIELRILTQGTASLIQQLLALKVGDMVSLQFPKGQGTPVPIGVKITDTTKQRSLGSLDANEIARIGGLLDLTKSSLYTLLSQLYGGMPISDDTEVYLMHFKRG